MPITYRFAGQISHDALLDYYKQGVVDCFVSTSSSEGLPVSIMEAMACGIPIIATSVGGVSELIDENGFLLSAHPTSQEVAGAIEKILLLPNERRLACQSKSREIWQSKFDSGFNAASFVNRIETAYGRGNTIYYVVDSVAGNLCFFNDEIKRLCRHNKVILIESKRNGNRTKIEGIEQFQKEHPNIEIRKFLNDTPFSRKLVWAFLYWFNPITKIERKNLLRYGFSKKAIYRWIASIKYYVEAEAFYKWMEDTFAIRSMHNVIFYSFWQQPTTLGMCLHKGDKVLITRTHGYDLYHERVAEGRQPFREFMDEVLDSVLFISKAGMDYYIKRNRVVYEPNKHAVCYLGSKGPATMVWKDVQRDTFTIVSCSNLIELKRVDLLIDAIAKLIKKHPERTFVWIHFGDGNLKEYLEDYAKKKFREL